MSKERHGTIGAYMDALTNRHTSEAIFAGLAKRRQSKPPDPAKVAANHAQLTEKGILPLLDLGSVIISLPGGALGRALSVNEYGFVVVEGEAHPFNPKAISLAK